MGLLPPRQGFVFQDVVVHAVRLATDSREDGGWHGNYSVYGMAYTEGVIGVFSGWGTPGIYIGSDDGITWSHLNKEPAKLGSVWGATGGKGVMLTGADQWRGITSSSKNHANWRKHSLKLSLIHI